MRDISLPQHTLLSVSPRSSDVDMNADPENAPPVPALPPMYVGVDPRLHFSGFVKAGNGASGTVFFARRLDASHQLVALKRVSPSTKAKSKALENEIRTMHVLRHQNIVQCHEAYSFDGSVWIVMEAMDVGCLTHVLDFLRAKAYLLSEEHIAYILRETLLGLWTMHSHSRMHRDIKSDNILVSSDGEIKLADFEYTAVLTEDTPKRNTVVGTAWWMAPETVRTTIMVRTCGLSGFYRWNAPNGYRRCLAWRATKRWKSSAREQLSRALRDRTCGAWNLQTL